MSSKNENLVPSISILEDILLKPNLTLLMLTDGAYSVPTAYSPNSICISRWRSTKEALIDPDSYS